MGRRAIALVAVAAVLLAGSCGGDEDTPAAPTSTAAPTSAGPTSTGSTDLPSTSGPTSVPATPTTSAGTLTVEVFFLDEDAFNIGRAPYVVPVDRQVPSASPARGALDALFAGPTAEEGAAGLRFVASEATGIASVRIEAGTAHVQLAGGCSSGGSTFTIADHIVPTLRQFTTVDAVKIYDPSGATEVPEEPGDSIPECLEP